MPDNEAVSTNRSIMDEIRDEIREITDTGKQKALAKFIQIMRHHDTKGWTEEKYLDAWKVFQVSERLERIEKRSEEREAWVKRGVLMILKGWGWIK